MSKSRKGWRVYANHGDPTERLKANKNNNGGYEVITLEGDEVGIMPQDVFEEIYQEVEDAQDAE